MLGHNHAMSGAVVAVCSLPLLPSADAAMSTAWVLAVAGASLLPDLDTTSSTAARMWGPLSGALARLIGGLTGGHRWGSHDAVLAPLVLVSAAALASTSRWGALCVLTLLVGLSLSAVRVLGLFRVGWVVNLMLSCAAGWWLTAHPGSALETRWWLLLAVAVGVGVLVHIAGDAITNDGVPVPVLWLTSNAGRGGAPLFTTGGLVETFVVAPALLAGLLGALWWQVPAVHGLVEAGLH